MSDTVPESSAVPGERGAHAFARTLSMQSRISNVLAIALMSVLGLGSLTWYYAHALLNRGSAQQQASAVSVKRAQGEMPLPSLGRIDAPPPPAPAPPPTLGPEPLMEVASPLPVSESVVAPSAPLGSGGAPPPKTAAQLALERALSGAVFSTQSAGAPGAVTPASSTAASFEPGFVPREVISLPANGPAGAPQAAVGAGSLSSLLHATASPAVSAQVLPAQRLLLPKGAFIDCTLETAIDSSLPGMTTCVMATDTFGVDGHVVLMERGTKLVGETRGQVQQGAARIFVLWTEARTPTGVVVPLDSPGADELGRSGLPGEVDRHFWQRFGAAMLVSVIDGAVQAAAQSAHGGSGNVVLNPSSSQDVLTEILKNTINVPPTVVKHNGDRIQVLVARDLDFRSVYDLRAVVPGR